MKKITVLAVFLPALLAAQSFSGGFNFSLPYNDTTQQRFFPSFAPQAIGNASFVSAGTDGHFVRNGSPLRFWGVNLAASAAFPDKNEAAGIAGRLRKMGFNLIRFHHMDNNWGSGTSLFDYGSDTRHLNADRLDKLEYFLAECSRNGIYANINLHVSRTFSAKDGLADADSIALKGPEMSKGIYYFDPQVRMLNKEYARQLLTHVNPYTGRSLAADPVMAMVELTNEDLLTRMWRDGQLKPYAMGGMLTIRHAKMLDSLWNAFLYTKYSSAQALSDAWNAGSLQEGALSGVKNGGFESVPLLSSWQLEQNTPTASTGTLAVDTSNPASGIFCAKATVTMTDGVNWHLQLKQTGLSIVKDSAYVVRFSARASGALPLDAGVMKETSPYTGYASAPHIVLGTSWKTYSFTFTAAESNINDVRLTFQIAGQKGTYWFDDVVMARSGVQGLPAGEDFAHRTIRRVDYADCPGATDQRVRDMSEFYLTLQRSCLREMKSFVQDTLGVRVPVTGTNWYSDQSECATQSEMDYIDNHAYWDHPSFPTIPWSPTDWTISNTAMVKNLSTRSTFPSLTAGVAMKGKPYTISEYNHAYPNRYQVEGPVFLAAYSSFHDVAGIMLFDYNGGTGWTADKVSSYFDIQRNTAMMSLMPSCAFAYRNGLLQTARETQLIDFSETDILQMPKSAAAVQFNKMTALEHGLRVSDYAAAQTNAASYRSAGANPHVSDTREIVWNTEGMFTAASPRFAAAAGFFDAMPLQTAGALTVRSATGFAALTWLSLTEDSLADASRSLLTVSTRVQNLGQIWDGTTTLHNNWGFSLTLMEPITASLSLRLHADSITVYPLNEQGATFGAPSVRRPSADDQARFDLEINQNDAHTVWFGIELFGNHMTGVHGQAEPAPARYALEQNYPNPFNPSTVIGYELPARTTVTLGVYDLLGREIALLVNGEQAAGRHSVTFSSTGRGISSGIYIYRLRAGTYAAQRAMVILK